MENRLKIEDREEHVRALLLRSEQEGSIRMADVVAFHMESYVEFPFISRCETCEGTDCVHVGPDLFIEDRFLAFEVALLEHGYRMHQMSDREQAGRRPFKRMAEFPFPCGCKEEDD